MAFNLESYLENSGPLSLAGIDFSQARVHPIDGDTLRALDYFTDVEGHTILWVRDLLNTAIRHDPRLTTFISCWNYEEMFHSRSLDKFLAAYGAPTGGGRLRSVRANVNFFKEKLESLGVAVMGIHPGFLRGVYFSWGAASEYLTLTGYQIMARRTSNPVLKEVLLRIGRDERKHFAFYFNEAQEVLQQSELVRRVTAAVLCRAWTPVGTGVKKQEEVDFLLTYLSHSLDGEGRRMLADVDQKIARLPGLGGFAAMGKALGALGL